MGSSSLKLCQLLLQIRPKLLAVTVDLNHVLGQIQSRFETKLQRGRGSRWGRSGLLVGLGVLDRESWIVGRIKRLCIKQHVGLSSHGTDPDYILVLQR